MAKMSGRASIAAALIALASCARPASIPPDPLRPIHVGDAEVTPDIARSLQEASADFAAAIAGKCPVFAKFYPATTPLLADGGTVTYRGAGYHLTIVQSLSDIGLMTDNGAFDDQGGYRSKHYVHGYLYGPVVTFDAKIMFGNGNTLSHVTYYSHDALKALRGDPAVVCSTVRSSE